MVPSKTHIEKLHRKYASDQTAFNLVYEHGQIVYEIANWCVQKNSLQVNDDILKASCLLHDIGSYLFIAANPWSDRSYYMQHALIGSTILEEEGCDERIVSAVRTHVLMGITEEEIEANDLRLPPRDYEPQTIEAELLCYADRFHSKTPQFNSLEYFTGKLASFLPNQAEKLRLAADRFGVPEVSVFAKKYDHPVR